MSVVNITLPDHSVKIFPDKPTVLEVAVSIGERLAKDTVGGRINGSKEVIDLRTRLEDGTKLSIVSLRDAAALEVIRHSAAHLMAQAAQELWPDVKVTIGPVIDAGFYYDFDSTRLFTPVDLEVLEKKMEEIIARDESIMRKHWSSEKAIEVFGAMGERFKVEIIKDLNIPEVDIYQQGPWFDLCRGPHLQRMGQIKAVKVLHTAGAYWRGKHSNPQLQRIYGTAFGDKKALKQHLYHLEEAKKRDHRKVGKELGLIYFHPHAPSAPFFTPKGTVIYNELQKYLQERYREYGYSEVLTPQIFDVALYKQSGHYDNYLENMYFTKVDDRDFSVKPMNCPGHCLLYGAEKKSYRDLPWRIADFGRLHRKERSGALQGLTRVVSFCQDDGHIFCRPDQLQEEIALFMKFLNEVYVKLGMVEYQVFFSTRPEKRMGSDELWTQAEKALEQALKSQKIDYQTNPGDGAFYGPKLDIMFIDALKRPWQLGTIQCDFNMPEAFQLKFVGEDNNNHQPVMLHRAILGSFERFFGVYLEHTAGKLPTWLSPAQVVIMNITDEQWDYCCKLQSEMKALGIRVEFDSRNEKLGFKVREAQLKKIPYMLTVGDKEVAKDVVAVRLLSGKTLYGVDRSEFISKLLLEIKNRDLETPWANVLGGNH